MNNWRDKTLIFSIAFIVRLIVGYIFYGSIDVSAFISIGKHTFAGTLLSQPQLAYNLFPSLLFYLWLSSLLAAVTKLPVAFCFKVIPVLFDALLALLIYDLVKVYRPTHARAVGYLYALSPIALIVTCIHGQWDSMPLFFLVLGLYIREFYIDSRGKYLVYGVLFALSFLIKPMTLIFLPLFFVPYPGFTKAIGRYWVMLKLLGVIMLGCIVAGFLFFKICRTASIAVLVGTLFVHRYVYATVGVVALAALCVMLRYAVKSIAIEHLTYLYNQLLSSVGLILSFFIALGAFYWYGFNPIVLTDRVLRYLNQGVSIFGLPFAYPFNQWPLAFLLKNRFWIMLPIAGVVFRYYLSKINVFNAIAVVLALIFGVAGLSPQYFLWLVPFLLIGGFYRIFAMYTLVLVPFCLLFYMNPWTNPEVVYQYMLSFAPLKQCTWLMPPAFLTIRELLIFIRFIGNYVVPVMCLLMAWYMFHCPCPIVKKVPNRLLLVRSGYLWGNIVCTAMAAVLMVVVSTGRLAQALELRVTQRFDVYDTQIIDSFLCGNYGVYKPFNIIFLLLVLAAVIGVLSWRWAGAGKSE